LIKGDLLMARARPLSRMGDVPGGVSNPESVADLQAEARMRMLRYLEQPDPSRLPRQILQLAPSQRYALLADASRARLYLFENMDGEPRLKRDFYLTIGRNGLDKYVEGDKRTPIGVYHIIEQLPGRQLPDLYGEGAYPLDYPNALDRMQGRSGHGIWLHGVPSDTYSRSPRASDGCLAVSNPDLIELGRYIQVGVTPVVIVDRVDWVERHEWEESRAQLLQTIEAWRHDWQTRNANRFLTHYSPEFLRGAGGDWAETKRRNIENKTWITVSLRDLSVFVYPGGNLAYAEFVQEYASDRLTSTDRKRQYWQRQGQRWRILLEVSGDDPPPRGSRVARR
jgi:murein L,D-transpeptidase YafK